MGTDIHVKAELFLEGKWVEVKVPEALLNRNYAVFAYLANVRNYHAVKPLFPDRGFPEDTTSPEDSRDFWNISYDPWNGYHSITWYSIVELLAIKPEFVIENRRGKGFNTLPEGQGVKETLLEFLEETFFQAIDELAYSGVQRIIIGFDG